MSPIYDRELPHNARPDLTPYLIHLTRKTDDCGGLEILESILREGRIYGTTRYFVGTSQKATCFMDVPFMALKYVCCEDNSNRYEPYGVVIQKFSAYRNQGARPVLYLSADERRMLDIPEDELWRVVTLELSEEGQQWESNWLHEREWRAPGDFDLPKSIHAVLVKTPSDAAELQGKISQDPSDFRCIPKSIIPLTVMCQGLVY
ncbi:MAG: hypothetical protein KF747_15460 [Nitrospira sp.]|nr:hypothetical protein [Nitrospira sp.]